MKWLSLLLILAAFGCNDQAAESGQFVGNRSTLGYVAADDPRAQSIPAKDRVSFANKSEAEGAGYTEGKLEPPKKVTP